MRRTVLVFAWIVAALLFAALTAQVMGYRDIWSGSSDVFLVYLVPMPISEGFFHLPSLVVGAVLVGLLPVLGDRGRSLIQWTMLAVFVGGALLIWEGVRTPGFQVRPQSALDWLSYRLRGFDRNPLAHFVMSDALLVLFTSWIVPSRDGAAGEVARRIARRRVLWAIAGLGSIAFAGLIVIELLFVPGDPRYTIVATERDGCLVTEYIVIDDFLNDRYQRKHARDWARSRRPTRNEGICRRRMYYFGSEEAVATRRPDRAVLAGCVDHRRSLLYRPPGLEEHMQRVCSSKKRS